MLVVVAGLIQLGLDDSWIPAGLYDGERRPMCDQAIIMPIADLHLAVCLIRGEHPGLRAALGAAGAEVVGDTSKPDALVDIRTVEDRLNLINFGGVWGSAAVPLRRFLVQWRALRELVIAEGRPSASAARAAIADAVNASREWGVG